MERVSIGMILVSPRLSPPPTFAIAASSTPSTNQQQKQAQVDPQVVHLKGHLGSVRGVAFSPRFEDVFCSGGYDSVVQIYNTQQAKRTASIRLNDFGAIKAVAFCSNGCNLLVSSNSRQVALIDVGTAQHVSTFNSASFMGRDRSALATASDRLSRCAFEHIATSSNHDGKGLTYIDLRTQKPCRSIEDIHTGIIRDVAFLQPSFASFLGCSNYSAEALPPLITASEDGKGKVLNGDGQVLSTFSLSEPVYSITCTPEPINQTLPGFDSGFAFGGSGVHIVHASNSYQKLLLYKQCDGPVWRLKYTSNGTRLFAGCDDGRVRIFRRNRQGEHELISQVMMHRDDIEDLDISPNNEYLITASQDKNVGLLRIGEPSHGTSCFSQYQ